MTQEKNRVHKVLEDANIKITTYISDIFGVSELALLRKLVDGEVLTREDLLDLVKTQLKKKIPLILDALNGGFLSTTETC